MARINSPGDGQSAMEMACSRAWICLGWRVDGSSWWFERSDVGELGRPIAAVIGALSLVMKIVHRNRAHISQTSR
jgi:hypothetical protein